MPDPDARPAARGMRDLTKGAPALCLLRFAIPLALGTLFQQMYSLADTAIVGRCLGEQALAAVGTTSSMSFLVMGFVQGVCIGFGVPQAQSFGAKDSARLGQYFWNGAYLTALFAAVLTVSATWGAQAMLTLMRTPAELQGMALAYAQVLLAGLPASFLNNYSACALRAVGDSRHPFCFLAFSTVLNIGLDLLFIVPLHGGVASAAAATVLSQLASGLLNTWWLFARARAVPGWRRRAAPDPARMAALCRVGLPMGLECAISSLGAFALQWAINQLGSVAVAAQTTGERIRQMFTTPMESVGMAMATYTGQNCGARRLDRVRAGIRGGLAIQWIYCAAAWVAIRLIRAPAVALVLGTVQSPAALGAMEYLDRISVLFCIHGALMIVRNTLQGLGYAPQAMLGGVGEILGRAAGGMLAVTTGLGFVAVCYASPLAWTFSLLYCSWQVRRALRREQALQPADAP